MVGTRKKNRVVFRLSHAVGRSQNSLGQLDETAGRNDSMKRLDETTTEMMRVEGGGKNGGIEE